MNIHAAVSHARTRLRAAGIPDDEADLDARLLAQHVLGWTTAEYFTNTDALRPEGFDDAFEGLVARRAAREPYAYIVGHEEFWGIDVEVTPAVLIPRPETEMLVELTMAECPPDTTLSIADVCTGSGCIAVALARELP